MGVHGRLVLLLAVHGVVVGRRMRDAKLLLGRKHSSKLGIKDPLANKKAREAGQGKNTYASAELHGSLEPQQQLTGDAQTSLHGADSAEGASLVQNTTNSVDTSRLSNTFLVESDKLSSTDTLGSTWKLGDVMYGLPAKGLITKGKREGMQAFGSGLDHGILVAGISGFLVIVCCICYCGVSLLRYGMRAPKAAQKQRPEPNKNTLSFERKPYIHEGREVFEWEQCGSTVKLYLKVPKGVTKSDLDIKISPHHIQIGCVGKEPFMQEEVYDKVNIEDSGWRLCSNGELQIMLQKDDSSVWPRVLK